MAAQTLALLGLLAAAASLAAGECGSREFQCKDGSGCVPADGRCDGDSDCADGSDEQGCDALPRVALPAAASVTARVQFAAAHGRIELYLCGAQRCSGLLLWGQGDDGALRYQTLQGCDRRGGGGRIDQNNVEGSKVFPAGEVVLEVQHRPGQLAVWRQGRPDDVVEATVEAAVEADNATLLVRPHHWVSDMPVQFTAAGGCGLGYFRCGGGQCVWGAARCDGEAHCADGADEAGCDALLAAHTAALPANASLTARLQYAAVHDAVELHLCGAQHCRSWLLLGETDNGMLRSTPVVGCYRLGTYCYAPGKFRLPRGRKFRPGELVLKLEHGPEHLAIWRQDRPDNTLVVSVKADYATLRVRPNNWVADMPVQFTGSPVPGPVPAQ